MTRWVVKIIISLLFINIIIMIVLYKRSSIFKNEVSISLTENIIENYISCENNHITVVYFLKNQIKSPIISRDRTYIKAEVKFLSSIEESTGVISPVFSRGGTFFGNLDKLKEMPPKEVRKLYMEIENKLGYAFFADVKIISSSQPDLNGKDIRVFYGSFSCPLERCSSGLNRISCE